jgi:murein DD-endopeptidase MepM/ murein hydrolase activator NlpD
VKKRVKTLLRRTLAATLGIIIAGFLVPERRLIPVEGASPLDWNKDTFWYEPWGASGVHKGIDIFAAKGTPVVASTGGFVFHRGSVARGGNIALVLGPKWRIHYYAHMDQTLVSTGQFLSRGDAIGTVGDSGNAVGKQSHLHYVTLSIFPYPWLADSSTQGWKKMFYLDPNTRLR